MFHLFWRSGVMWKRGTRHVTNSNQTKVRVAIPDVIANVEMQLKSGNIKACFIISVPIRNYIWKKNQNVESLER